MLVLEGEQDVRRRIGGLSDQRPRSSRPFISAQPPRQKASGLKIVASLKPKKVALH